MPPSPKKSNKVSVATDWVQHEMEDVFGRIARYTRFVLFGKWALGSVALIILVTLIAWPLLLSDDAGMRISFSTETAGLSGSTAPVMHNPRYQGTDKEGQPYTVIAERAIQQSDELILLEAIQGELSTQDAKWLSVVARNGAFEDTKSQLTLSNGVVMKHEDGHVVVTDLAIIDTRNSTATGDKEVQVQSPMGSLLATGFEIRDNGAYMKFGMSGRVNVRLKKSRPHEEATL